MKSALSTLNAGAEELLKFLKRSESEQRLIGYLNTEERRAHLVNPEIELLDDLLEASTNSKQYIYIVAIVSMYGLLEQFVDEVIAKFVNGIGEICADFSELPEALKKNHLPLSVQLMDAVIKEKFRSDVSTDAIIANLNSCLSAGKGFKLNGVAFAVHKGNVSIDKISGMLSGIGVVAHLRRMLAMPAFNKFLIDSGVVGQAANDSDEEVRRLYVPIDELIERRNSVAHGVIAADELESIDLLRQRCKFLQAYTGALCSLLLDETYKHLAKIGVAKSLGSPIAVYNNKIVCFDSGEQISVGDTLFCLFPDGRELIRSGEILSLQINGESVDRLETEVSVKFGAEVNFHVNDGHSYYWLPNS